MTATTAATEPCAPGRTTMRSRTNQAQIAYCLDPGLVDRDDLLALCV